MMRRTIQICFVLSKVLYITIGMLYMTIPKAIVLFCILLINRTMRQLHTNKYFTKGFFSVQMDQQDLCKRTVFADLFSRKSNEWVLKMTSS